MLYAILVVLFVILYKGGSKVEVCGLNPCVEQYFHVVLFIVLFKMFLSCKFLDKTLVCDHSNNSYLALLSCGTVYYAVQGVFNFESVCV